MEGSAEKQGKRLWASRYLVLVGCRLFIYRYPLSCKRGNQNIPLNVIDLTNALIEGTKKNSISITTHRCYELRFASPVLVTQWMVELKKASGRGLSLFNTPIEVIQENTMSITEDTIQDTVETKRKLDLHRPPPLDLSSPVLATANCTQEPRIVPHAMTFSSYSTDESRHNTILHPLPSYIGNKTATDSISSSTTSDNGTVISNDSIALSIIAWGNNTMHQLGCINVTNSSTPLLINQISSPICFPVIIKSGNCHSLCLSDEGELYSWGNNHYGQLGTGNNEESEDGTPFYISHLRNIVIVSIACGGFHSACISSTGTVYSWGHGVYGQLGQGLATDIAYEPNPIVSLRNKNIESVYCGQNHTVFLSSTGLVYSCGNGYYGQLGLEQEIDYFTPTQITSLANHCIKQVACGETFTVFVSNTNKLFVTGMLECTEDVYEQKKALLSKPHEVPFEEHIIKIAAGSRYVLILSSKSVDTRDDTHVYLWKADETHTELLSKPVLIPSLSNHKITNLACGASHCIVYSSITSKAFAWGCNTSGELGMDSKEDVNNMIEIIPPDGVKFVQICCGNAFTVAITLPLSSNNTLTSTLHFNKQGLYSTPTIQALDTLQFSRNSDTTVIMNVTDDISSIPKVADSIEGFSCSRFVRTPTLHRNRTQHITECEHNEEQNMFDFNSNEIHKMDRATIAYSAMYPQDDSSSTERRIKTDMNTLDSNGRASYVC